MTGALQSTFIKSETNYERCSKRIGLWYAREIQNRFSSGADDQAGLPGSQNIHAGNSKHVLEVEAERWNADCIFVGANAFGSRVERFLLGSTSAAVATRAHCSVEVVRQ